jgi:hypothetical protein
MIVAVTPTWAQRRTPEEQAEMERAEILAEVMEWRGVDPRELGRRMAALVAAATAAARRSPYWERASAPEPMAPGDEARWRRLVEEHRGRG